MIHASFFHFSLLNHVCSDSTKLSSARGGYKKRNNKSVEEWEIGNKEKRKHAFFLTQATRVNTILTADVIDLTLPDEEATLLNDGGEDTEFGIPQVVL